MAKSGTKELERTKSVESVKEPRMYRVILLNDHYTSMEFVVAILEGVFNGDCYLVTRAPSGGAVIFDPSGLGMKRNE